MYSDRTDKPESPDLYRLHTSESRESIGRSSRLALFGLGRPPLIDGLFFGDGMRIPPSFQLDQPFIIPRSF